MIQEKNTFETLRNVNLNEKLKEKVGLKYLSWAHAWETIKALYPDAIRTIYKRTIHTEKSSTMTLSDGTIETTKVTYDNDVPYFTDGKTCFVRVGVTINGIEYVEEYPVMDLKNKAIRLEGITSVDVNKAIQRAFVKACAWHGLGIYVYAGEDVPESERVTIDYNALKQDCEIKTLTEEEFNKLKQETISIVQSSSSLDSAVGEEIYKYTSELFPNKRLSLLGMEDAENLQKLYSFLTRLMSALKK